MFASVLIANRGEIAVRVARTLRRLGIRSVVLASIPDRHSLAVRSADDWVLLEGYSAGETYLDMELVLGAAREKGCEAIHPGYGFLSENPEFAERCANAGIVFVGPPPAALRLLGDKSAARELAMANGVPIVPGWDGADDDATLAREAQRLGYPVMIKARGGGGGRGMREVFVAGDLAEAAAGARREAESAFGDGRLLLEKLVTEAHHVEIQVLADAHGNAIHLGERDCSVQRRHQKLIEESPSPVVDDALRAELTEAALLLTRAASYVNAGTIEFLVAAPDPSGRRPFYFLEANPRLQVEHPVTEVRTGLDLVELQLRVAAGEALPLTQEDVTFTGHAIEFRINAEDPWNDFRPSAGEVHHDIDAGVRGTRADLGYVDGDAFPSNYDSLVAKYIATDASRETCLESVLGTIWRLDDDRFGLNVSLHEAVLSSADFRDGRATVDWLERFLVSARRPAVPERWWIAAAGGLVALSPGGQFSGGGGSFWLRSGSDTRQIRVSLPSRDRVRVTIGDSTATCQIVDRDRHDSASVRLSDRVDPAPMWLVREAAQIAVADRSETGLRLWRFRIVPPPPLPRRPHTSAEGAAGVTAPLAGTVTSVRVREGDTVEPGDLLLTIEAIKMEHRITASAAGTVARVAVAERDVVREGDVLVEID